MTAWIYAHPRLSSLQLALLCEAYRLRAEDEFKAGNRPPIVRLEVRPKAPAECYYCVSCGWSGRQPAMIDTQDFFQPPRGEVPGCPRCDSLNLKPPQVRSCQSPP